MNADRQGFECDHCYGYLPDFPAHGEHGTYCGVYCRAEAEPVEGTINETEGEQS